MKVDARVGRSFAIQQPLLNRIGLDSLEDFHASIFWASATAYHSNHAERTQTVKRFFAKTLRACFHELTGSVNLKTKFLGGTGFCHSINYRDQQQISAGLQSIQGELGGIRKSPQI